MNAQYLGSYQIDCLLLLYVANTYCGNIIYHKNYKRIHVECFYNSFPSFSKICSGTVTAVHLYQGAFVDIGGVHDGYALFFFRLCTITSEITEILYADSIN